MTLTARMILQMEAAEAKAETVAVTGEVKKLTTATNDLGSKSKAAASASGAEAAAKVRNAAASREMAAAHRSAAGQTGNLVAQLNDVTMMIMAGQSPLQLAIQQGSQITQSWGPGGAAGAAKSLGTAVGAMLSPLNLATYAVIGITAAFFNWLTGADEEAAALTAQLERQKSALEGIVAETEKLRLAQGMALTGAKSEDEQVVLEEINRLTNDRAAAQERLNTLQQVGSRAAGFAEQASAQREALAAEIASLDAKIATLEKQREITAATQRNAEFAEQLKSSTLGVNAALQAADGSKLTAAFGAAFPLAQGLLATAQGIVSTLSQVSPLVSAQMGLSAAGKTYSGRGGDPRTSNQQGYGEFVYTGPSLDAFNNPISPGKGGGGGGAARDEASALQELITSLEAEIAALHEQDPIQQEMLKHREALAGATEAERAKVEELIATREREAMLMEGATARAQFFEDIGTQALDALIMKGESFNDVLKGVISSLIKAIAQAAIFGSGPFGSLFGGKSILSFLLPAAKADGGMVQGPGTATSDSIPTLLSNGEFVINAKATAKNRHLLESINSGGRIAGFAQGGMVGSDTRRLSARGDGSSLPGTIYMDLRGVQGDLAIEEKVRKGAAEVVKMYDREGLPMSMQRVSGDPRRRG